MRRRTQVIAAVAATAVLFTAGAFGIVRSRSNDDPPPAVAVAGPDAAAGLAHQSGASLDQMITNLQARLKATPDDYVSWATLGLTYVQQAKVTVNSDFYPLAEGVLQKSIDINTADNFLGYAGLSALASARHDFAAAETYANQGLAINAYSSILYGALSDAQTQLGKYEEAFASVQKMVDLRPDTSSLSRASYTWELRGDVAKATELMQRALDDAPNASDRAFALFYLGELAFNAGDANAALTSYRSALDASAGDAAALAGKAKAEAALGQNLTAIDDYAEVVQQTPEPSYILEYGELLQSLGRDAEAQQQYDVFETTQKLFQANGVEPDATAALFYANHGDPAKALEESEQGISTRPFLVMYDAYAWALHVNGRDDEALQASQKAASVGIVSALFLFHSGMIKHALGDDDGARADLQHALAVNPTFNPLDVPVAQQTLAMLGASS